MADLRRRPSILWIIGAYPPAQHGGAEWMVHLLNRYLVQKKGCRVVVVSDRLQNSSFDGVEIRNYFEAGDVRSLVQESSLVLTQYDLAPLAVYLARACSKPIVHVTHNPTTNQELLLSFGRRRGEYVICNAAWVRDELRLPAPGIIVHPPVDWREYQVESNHRYVSLINVNENKGGSVLVELARRMPDREFLGLKVHGIPIIEEGIPNLTYLSPVADIREVYSQTRVLIMPSRLEGWGMAGVEAMCSGIPVIAHPNPGLRESLSYAGLFCDRENIDDWVRTLRALDDPTYYQEVSARSMQRSRELDPAEDLKRFGDFVDQILVD